MHNLFGKLLLLIVTLALIGLSLLVVRQERYLTAARITAHHREVRQAERQVWELQAELARRVTPQRLGELAQRHGLSAPRQRTQGEMLAVRLIDPLHDGVTATRLAESGSRKRPGPGLALVALTMDELSEEAGDE